MSKCREEFEAQMRQEAMEFAAANIKECAEELLEWSETGVLRDGKVRELALQCKEWGGEYYRLSIAKGIVQHAALAVVAKRVTK